MINKIFTVSDALLSLKPKASFVLRGTELEWLDEIQSKPTEEEIQNEIIRLEQEYQSKEYQRLRVTEYPSIQEQLDMQYWDGINGTTIWQDTIQAIKDKYPKPEVIG